MAELQARSIQDITVHEPKKRLIAALPFPDRVIQHAVNNVIEPLIEKRFYYHSYACRKGKGMHKASKTLTRWIRNLSYEGVSLYAIKGDIRHYFQSIDHDKLKTALRRIIKDTRALWLIEQIIDSNGENKGIPVGNLTSQLFANLYLDKLDKYVKEQLHEKYYIRYVDDFLILSHDEQHLRQVLSDIETFLATELCLSLNPKTTILAAKNGIDFCGYRHWKDHKKIRKTSVRRMQKRVAAYKRGKLTPEHFNKSVQSWLGHVSHADTFALRKNMLQHIGSGNSE